MNGCKHEWHDYHRLSFPCPDCGAWADESNSSVTDYHELPEVPKCCATCRWMSKDFSMCLHPDDYLHGIAVAPHGLCSHWERRDDHARRRPRSHRSQR